MQKQQLKWLILAVILAGGGVLTQAAGIVLPSGWYSSNRTYYWIGGDTGTLTEAANWSDSEGGEALSSVSINSGANLVFTKDVAITLSGNSDVGNTYFAGNVSFTPSGTSQYRLNMTRSAYGSGKVTLAGKSYIRAASRNITIEPSLEIIGDNILGNTTRSSDDGKTITVAGALSGTGTLTLNATTSFTGSLAAFAGTIAIPKEDAFVAAAREWTLGDGGKVRFASATVAIDEAVPFPFASGATVTLATASHKAGDVLFTCTSGTAADWSGVKFTINSPNTGAASPFYGTPTIEDDAESGSVLVKAAYKDTVAVWGGGTSGLGTAANWNDVNGSPLSGNSVSTDKPRIFAGEYALTVDGGINMGSVLFLGDVQFTATNPNSDSQYIALYGGTWEGPGKVTFNLHRIRGINNAKSNIYSDVDVVGLKQLVPRNSTHEIHFRGKVSGAATLSITLKDERVSSSDTAGAVIFHGDMSDFKGTLTTSWAHSNSYLRFADAATNAANATVVLGEKGNAAAVCSDAGTYTFGSLSGKVTGGAAAVAIVTKATADTEIAYTAGTGAWTLENNGTATVTVTGSNFAGYTASGAGSVAVASMSGVASLTKVVTEANQKTPALIVNGSGDADLSGLNLTLKGENLSGTYYLVRAASLGNGDPAAFVCDPANDKVSLKRLTVGEDAVLAAVRPVGLVIIVR